jgi:hypothetical protein
LLVPPPQQPPPLSLIKEEEEEAEEEEDGGEKRPQEIDFARLGLSPRLVCVSSPALPAPASSLLVLLGFPSPDSQPAGRSVPFSSAFDSIAQRFNTIAQRFNSIAQRDHPHAHSQIHPRFYLL